MRNITIVLITLLFISGCGYIPSAKYSRAVVGENISTSVIISLVDPENSVIIKDGVDSAIIEVFHASLTTKALSTTHLTVKLSNPSYTPIQYDVDGFVVSYRTTVNLRITRSTNGEDSKDYNVRGTFDFSITPNAIISDKQRFDAIKFSSTKAIKSFVAQVSAEGARTERTSTPTKIKEVAVEEVEEAVEEVEAVVEVAEEAPETTEEETKKEEEVAAVEEEIVLQRVVKQEAVRPRKTIPKVEKKSVSKTTKSIRTRLDELDKAYKMKIEGLLSEEEFKVMKNDILGK